MTSPVHAPTAPPQPRVRRFPPAPNPDIDGDPTWRGGAADTDATADDVWQRNQAPPEPAPPPWQPAPADADPNQEATNIIRSIPEELLDD